MTTENVANSSAQVTEPLLAICIASYNRRQCVRASVDYLIQARGRERTAPAKRD